MESFTPFCSSYSLKINNILHISRNNSASIDSAINTSTVVTPFDTNSFISIISLYVLLDNISKLNNYPPKCHFLV